MLPCNGMISTKSIFRCEFALALSLTFYCDSPLNIDFVDIMLLQGNKNSLVQPSK